MDIAVATRPVRPDDGPLFCRMWSRLSRETVYRRFHAPLHSVPPGMLRHFLAVDHDLREAVVAVVGEEVVGVARYDRSPAQPDVADVAVLVEDAWQGVGVGRQLLTELNELAGSRGVRVLTASVQADNDRALGLARRLLPGATSSVEAGIRTVRSPLPRVPAAAGV
jgi:GNAT superfamily N-acetyltransferase